jgi:CHAT domain-containing protein
VLQRSDIQILHFSGHGDYDPAFADLNSILLEDGDFEAFRLQGTPLGLKAHPILYLNACSAGKSGVAVGRMGGFAAKCLSSGCSGIIAPYWPINDARAADFSIALYTKLNQGRAVGEALQELRQENLDDPTFRAYAYLGDPWTRPVFPL